MPARKKKTAKKQRKTSFAPRQQTSRPLMGIPLIAIALLYVVALIDFDIMQSPNYRAGDEPAGNLAGQLGIWLGESTFWLLGVIGWAVPVLLFYFGWLLVSPAAKRVTFSISAAAVVAVITACGLTQLLETQFAEEDALVAEQAAVDTLQIETVEEPERLSNYRFNGIAGATGKMLNNQKISEAIGPAGIGLANGCLMVLAVVWLFHDAIGQFFKYLRTSNAKAKARREEQAAARKAVKKSAEAEPSKVKKEAAVEPEAKVVKAEAPPQRPLIGPEGKTRKKKDKRALKPGQAIIGETEVPPIEPLAGAKRRAGKASHTRTGFLIKRGAEEAEAAPERKKPAAPQAEQVADALPEESPQPATAGKGGLSIITYDAVEKVDVPQPEKRGAYAYPKVALLSEPPPPEQGQDPENFANTMDKLVHTLEQFKVTVTPGEIHTGPVITRYEVVPAPGVRVEKISGLDKNIALGLRAEAVRIVAPVPGKGTVGIEVPNSKPSPVYIREIIQSKAWANTKKEIPIVLGKDVTGKPIVEDLTRMPHMLIAGATGAGKTVCINAVITSLLYHAGPEDLRFIMVDPKMVEMQMYNDLPHMLIPVVTEPKKVPGALKYLLAQMEERYQIFARVGARNIAGFNKQVARNKQERERASEMEEHLSSTMSPEERAAANIQVPRDEGVSTEVPTKKMPYIVCIIDELADLMMVAPQDIETGIARLAQLARAAGIHLILATQRPSVNVITGVIKANLPTRISFKVASKVDSRTILDQGGAESLIGKGDMLYVPPGASTTVRAQGAFVSDEEITKLVDYLKENNDPPQIDELAQRQVETSLDEDGGDNFTLESQDADSDGALMQRAIEVIKATKRASTSSIQRRLKIGYNRAARIMDRLEDEGIVGPDNGSKPREILVDVDSL